MLFVYLNLICILFHILCRSDVEVGGETLFPLAKGNSSAAPQGNGLSNPVNNGIRVKPKMGDAVLFFYMMPDGTVDPLSLHG